MFNIRVYGLIINEKEEILLSDEMHHEMKMTKFPGGGLQFGEGTIDCLKREAMEEFKQEIEVKEHFYTTDFFQKAFFHENQQLISIYYLASFVDGASLCTIKKPFEGINRNGDEALRWMPIRSLKVEDMSLPVDKKVCEMLLSRFIK